MARLLSRMKTIIENHTCTDRGDREESIELGFRFGTGSGANLPVENLQKSSFFAVFQRFIADSLSCWHCYGYHWIELVETHRLVWFLELARVVDRIISPKINFVGFSLWRE